MGRPPCCDKVGVKKGPWTPEEDTMLISYVEEHGPGNWRAVPTKTGLRRCSKSCRLRWTNYLRPGIKRGTFTDHEEKMIVQLQALLGNKTDNDIKNYWNTHLKKKLKKLENGSGHDPTGINGYNSSNSHSRGQWERRLQSDDINTAKQALQDALTIDENKSYLSQELIVMPSNYNGSSYASNTENIARLLKDWVKNTPKSDHQESKSSSSGHNSSDFTMTMEYSNCAEGKTGIDLSEAFESLFGFESNFESSNNSDDFSRATSPSVVHGEIKPDSPTGLRPLSILENWLLDDQGKDYLTNFSFDENPNLF
ncbi:hypothetical protein DH2020_037898 [Rehmannia glutinosa]|uniref:R2R3-MYB protein n=1 Tax=Rehmannia glutinosa TaxID=99300 RepID=A0ABR0V2N2_REHGL